MKTNVRNEETSNEVKAAEINAKAVIIAAIIAVCGTFGGTLLGKFLESKETQVVLNQTFYGVIDSNDDITLEEIKQEYLLLQDSYNKKEQENKILANEKENGSDKLTEANQKIEELQAGTNEKVILQDDASVIVNKIQ